jgi:hypothetical protein
MITDLTGMELGVVLESLVLWKLIYRRVGLDPKRVTFSFKDETQVLPSRPLTISYVMLINERFDYVVNK